MCWISIQAISYLTALAEAALSAALPATKGPQPKQTSRETLVKSMQACFPPTHPSKHQDIRRPQRGPSLTWASQEEHKRLLLNRDSHSPKHITNQIIPIIESRELFTMNYMLSKSIRYSSKIGA